jgi:hypothetical protein
MDETIKFLENFVFSWVNGGEAGYEKKTPDGVINLHQLANVIHKDESLKRSTEAYRSTGVKSIKEQLPRFFPAGVFKKISKSGFLEDVADRYTWLVPFDFDLKDNPEMWDCPNWIDVLPKYTTPKAKEIFETIVCADPNVLLAFYSPSGGFKGLVMCKPGSFKLKSGNKLLASDVIRDQIYPMLEQKWGIKLDPAQSMMHMGMHLAHMERPHVNLSCKPLNVDIHLNIRKHKHNTPDTKMEVLEEWLDRLTNQTVNKWYDFTYIAFKIGQNVASKWWPQESFDRAIDALRRNGDIKDLSHAISSLTTSYEEGLLNPLDPELLHDRKPAKLFHESQLRYISSRLNDYVRIGTKYYHIVKQVNEKTGFEEETRLPWDKAEINDDFGAGANKTVTKFIGYENKPNYFRKIRHSGSFFNLFHPLKWDPVEGSIEHSLFFMKHIFGDQIEDGLDLIKIWYCYPRQKTHVLCLLSEENETGKSTFFLWLSYMFGHDNVTIMSSEDFASNFNGIWVTSNLICLDEGKLGQSKIDLGKKLRIWTTSEFGYLEEKHKDKQKVEFHGRFLIASNEVNKFLKINENDNRYWLRQIPRFQKFDPKFLTKLIDEIPHFLKYLKDREFHNPVEIGQTRFGLPHSVIQTSIRETVLEYSQDNMYHAILDWLKDWFAENQGREFFNATQSEWKEQILTKWSFENKWFKETIAKFKPIISDDPTHKEGSLRGFTKSTARWISISRETIYPKQKEESLW